MKAQRLYGLSTIITSDVYKSVDQDKDVWVVFFDISKAFDKVWHMVLLYKLEKKIEMNYSNGLEISYMIKKTMS